MLSKSKIKPKSIGSSGQTIYSLAPTSDLKKMYIGLDHKNVKVFDLQKNKLSSNFLSLKQFLKKNSFYQGNLFENVFFSIFIIKIPKF